MHFVAWCPPYWSTCPALLRGRCAGLRHGHGAAPRRHFLASRLRVTYKQQCGPDTAPLKSSRSSPTNGQLLWTLISISDHQPHPRPLDMLSTAILVLSLVLSAVTTYSLPTPHPPHERSTPTQAGVMYPRASRYPPSNYSGRLLARNSNGTFLGFVPKQVTSSGVFSSDWTNVSRRRYLFGTGMQRSWAGMRSGSDTVRCNPMQWSSPLWGTRTPTPNQREVFHGLSPRVPSLAATSMWQRVSAYSFLTS